MMELDERRLRSFLCCCRRHCALLLVFDSTAPRRILDALRDVPGQFKNIVQIARAATGCPWAGVSFVDYSKAQLQFAIAAEGSEDETQEVRFGESEPTLFFCVVCVEASDGAADYFDSPTSLLHADKSCSCCKWRTEAASTLPQHNVPCQYMLGSFSFTFGGNALLKFSRRSIRRGRRLR